MCSDFAWVREPNFRARPPDLHLAVSHFAVLLLGPGETVGLAELTADLALLGRQKLGQPLLSSI